MKQCSKCKKWKNESEFYGRHAECKLCSKKGINIYYKKNREKILEKKKKYNSQLQHRERIQEYNKKYYKIHKEILINHQKEYYKKNKRLVIKYKIKYNNKKYNTNPKYKLSKCISRMVNFSLKGNKNGYHWERLVGYTLKDLIEHLEKQFTKEMNWGNHGLYWHIDHIIPISAFNFNNYNQLDFKRCWALYNLRPLEKTENRKKNNKIDKSFQPNLKI